MTYNVFSGTLNPTHCHCLEHRHLAQRRECRTTECHHMHGLQLMFLNCIHTVWFSALFYSLEIKLVTMDELGVMVIQLRCETGDSHPSSIPSTTSALLGLPASYWSPFHRKIGLSITSSLPHCHSFLPAASFSSMHGGVLR